MEFSARYAQASLFLDAAVAGSLHPDDLARVHDTLGVVAVDRSRRDEPTGTD